MPPQTGTPSDPQPPVPASPPNPTVITPAPPAPAESAAASPAVPAPAAPAPAAPFEPTPAAPTPEPVPAPSTPAPTAPEPQSTPTVTPPVFSAATPPPPTGPTPAPAAKSLPQGKKRWLFMGAGILVLLLLLGGAYWLGTRKHVTNTHEATEANITIPKDATVTAQCADMRGKQYIIPKDIPMGPIYDVYQGKVVAMEYLVGEHELTSKTDMFSDLNLPKVDYDHLAVMPMDPHAGEDEPHFHVIAYLISKADAAKIMCSPGSDPMTMTGSQ